MFPYFSSHSFPLFFFHCPRPPPHLRSFPTRRSSDLPLRFLLADDPGAGKTIMAGLYIKELLLRDDVKRCLVVAPGGLVDRKSTRLNSSHRCISYAVFCLKKKKKKKKHKDTEQHNE